MLIHDDDDVYVGHCDRRGIIEFSVVIILLAFCGHWVFGKIFGMKKSVEFKFEKIIKHALEFKKLINWVWIWKKYQACFGFFPNLQKMPKIQLQ